jgi:hypothetical protein
MATTRVKPRGPFYECKHALTHPRVFVDISGRNSGQDGGCYPALDSVTLPASCQGISRETPHDWWRHCYQPQNGNHRVLKLGDISGHTYGIIPFNQLNLLIPATDNAIRHSDKCS